MPDQPAAEKTEQPTARQLRKAREKGKVPQSQELASAVSIASLSLMIALTGPNLLHWFMLEIQSDFACNHSLFADSRSFTHFVNSKMIETAVMISPILAVLTVTSICSGIAISGLNFSQSALMPKFESLNPAKGIQKLFNSRALVTLFVSVAKIIFVSLIVWLYLKNRIDDMAALRWAWSMQILVAISSLVISMLVRICIALFIIAAIEATWQKYKHIQDLKMTRQQVKDESKETEGSPEVKSRIRKAQYQTALKRVMQEVPKANVILVNPTHYAVAIRYDPKTMSAPKLLAKGTDHLAERIREIARAHGIPIIRRPELTRTIYGTVKEGGFIPENLYVAVAEVLALIYKLRHTRV